AVARDEPRRTAPGLVRRANGGTRRGGWQGCGSASRCRRPARSRPRRWPRSPAPPARRVWRRSGSPTTWSCRRRLTPATRLAAVLDEYVDLLRALWTAECASFQGRYYQVDRVYLLPHPVQRPMPPLWIGGHSRAALRRAAARGDGWHAAFLGPAAFADAVARL